MPRLQRDFFQCLDADEDDLNGEGSEKYRSNYPLKQKKAFMIEGIFI